MTVTFRSVKPWSYLTVALTILLASLLAYAYHRHNRIRGLVEDLKSSEPEVAQAAATSLREMGSDTVCYLIPMIKNMNSQSRTYTAEALRNVDSAVPSLVEVLNDDKDVDMRAASAEVLGKMGPAAKDSVPALIAALKDENEEVRREVKLALGEIKDPSAIEPLIKTFDHDPLSDNTAPVALGKIGSRAVPFLIEKLKDKTAKIHEFSAYALGEIGPPASNAVPSLLSLLNKDEPEGVRRKAAWALGKIKDERAVRQLIVLLANRFYPEDSIIEALGEIGPAAKEAAPLLKDRTWDINEMLHGFAIDARKKITPESMDEITRDEQDYASLENAVTSVKLQAPTREEIPTVDEEIPAKIPLTFKWIPANPKPGVIFCSTLLIDKGVGPFDGVVNLSVPAGHNSQVKVWLDAKEYYRSSPFEYGVRVIACRPGTGLSCNNPEPCVGRTFLSNVQKYSLED